MGVQALPLGKIRNAGGNGLQRLAGVIQKAGLLHKVVHAQRAGEAGRAAGGQGVVGPGEVIAQRLRDVPPQEDAARIFDLVQHAEGVLHADFQVLGCDDVAGFNGLVEVGAEDDLAVVVHAGPGNGGAGQLGNLNFQLRLHGLGQRLAVRHKDGAGQLVVLGLAQQVGRHPRGVAAAVRQHQNLAGACDHIDAHLAKNFPLGGGNVDVARAHDLIHRRDALGAVGQRRHGLRPAGLENFSHARRGCCREDDGVHLSVFARRGGHHDLGHPRHFRRDDVHQHGGGVGRRAAGHIDARLLNGGVFLAQHDAGLIVHHKVFVHLLAVEGLDVGGGLPQGLHKIGVGGRKGLVDLLLRHLQFLDGCAVKFQCVLLQRRIAPGPHIGNDAVHHVLHVLLGADVAVQNFFGLQLVKIVKLDHFAASCSARAPRSFVSISSISLCLNW